MYNDVASGIRRTRNVNDVLSDSARYLNESSDLDELIHQVGEARVVMLGESTHGTEEFYEWRNLISERLIAEKGFSFIAVEGDWPDCYRYNRYAKGYDTDSKTAREVVGSYRRWPQWMWANSAIVELVAWLRQYNSDLEPGERAGFYGLDVYSLWDSLEHTIGFISKNYPESIEKAKEVYRCFEPYKEDMIGYGYDAGWSNQNCRDEVVKMLVELLKSRPSYPQDFEERFNAERNARVVVNAEWYYRSMLEGEAKSWNIRDQHMMETLERLLTEHGPNAKAIVWAHNTHIGDARATDMKDSGMINLGQLVRQKFGEESTSAIGFGTYEGTVTAAEAWDAQAKIMKVPPALPGSWDEVFHDAIGEDSYVILNDLEDKDMFSERYGQRAIGVVYDPKMEKFGNYVPTRLSERYDIYMFFDKTSALEPLTPQSAGTEVPETFPSGL